MRALVVVLALAACSSKDPAPAKPPTQPTPVTPQPPADPCGDIRARFNQAYAARTDTCTTDADCGCYNPVGGHDMGCGGVTDKATVAVLTTIETEFHAAKCEWTHNCAAWACAPKCTQGRCTR